ncbi:MAG TPA: glycosyltransferase [Acidimicrobiia bacterium]|nr:glycosyltransferase [Acidimicrobiia bacterium]
MTRAFLLGQVLTVLLLAQVALLVWNLRIVRRPPPRRWRAGAPRISVLIPARNEEASIAQCVDALLAQDYPTLEIIVLDDDSTDGTAAIVRGRRDRRLRLVTGAPLPDGWTGKNWACHQLAARAHGEVLCFVDANTILARDTLSRAAGELRDSDLGLVSMLLRTDTGTASEAVLMPIVNYALLSLLPAALIEKPGFRKEAIALGPFVMVTRAAYAAAGGHAAEPAHIVDDVQLARSVKASGHRIALRNGTDLVRTRWYTGFAEIWHGFSKNAYGGIGYRPGIGLLTIFVVAPALLLPFLRLGAGITTGGTLAFPAVQVALILSMRAVTTRVGRDPLWSIPLHPVAIAVWAGTLARSMVLAHTGREIEWKGRRYLTRPLEPESERSRSEASA